MTSAQTLPAVTLAGTGLIPLPSGSTALTLPVAAPQLPSEFLTFRLGDEEYGMDIQRVQEIRRYEPTTRIANAPAFIRGVVNLRGEIVPILDMRLKLGLAEAQFNDFTVVIVIRVADRVFGLVVDAVCDVIELAADEIRPPPAFTGAVDARHILGIASVNTPDGQRLLILTDIERLMRSPEMGLMAQ